MNCVFALMAPEFMPGQPVDADRFDQANSEGIAGQRVAIRACSRGGEVELQLLQAASAAPLAALEQQLAPALEEGLLMMQHEGQPASSPSHSTTLCFMRRCNRKSPSAPKRSKRPTGIWPHSASPIR